MDRPTEEQTGIVPVAPEGAILPLSTWPREQVDLVKATVARGATDTELAMFLSTARGASLNPWLGEIYFIKRRIKNQETSQYEQVGTMQVGIAGLRKSAERTGTYAGQDAPIFEHDKDGNLVSATVRLHRKGWEHPVEATALYSEYAQAQSALWPRMPHAMLAKCAEALAFRKGWPGALSGVVGHFEMDQAGQPNEILQQEAQELAADGVPPEKIQDAIDEQGEADAKEADPHEADRPSEADRLRSNLLYRCKQQFESASALTEWLTACGFDHKLRDMDIDMLRKVEVEVDGLEQEKAAPQSATPPT